LGQRIDRNSQLIPPKPKLNPATTATAFIRGAVEAFAAHAMANNPTAIDISPAFSFHSWRVLRKNDCSNMATLLDPDLFPMLRQAEAGPFIENRSTMSPMCA
jgi:hypothetical protein